MFEKKAPWRHCGHGPVSRNEFKCPACRALNPNPTPPLEKVIVLAAVAALTLLGVAALLALAPAPYPAW